MNRNTNRSGRRAARETSPLVRLVKSLSAGLLLGASLALLLLLIGAGILSKTTDPDRLILPVGILTLVLSSLLAGFSSGKLYGGPRFFPAASSMAVLWVLLTYLLSLLIGGAEATLPGVYAILLRLISGGLVILGGMLAQKPKATPRRRTRKARR